MTEFDGAIVSFIFTCTPKEFIISKYLRDKFRFLNSNDKFHEVIKNAQKVRKKRVIGFIKNIGPLRIGVKEQWHQIIFSFENINKRLDHITIPIIPLYAVSKKQFHVSTKDKEGNTKKFSGKIIVSVYPTFTFSIRLIFKIGSTITANWLIDLIKQQQMDLVIRYKDKYFSKFIDFASHIKVWTLLSLFNSEYVNDVQVKLSKQNMAIYLKGTSLFTDLKPFVGIALGIKNFEELSSSVIEKYTKYMPQLYKGDVMVASEQGFVVYSPYLARIQSKLNRKRFRRNVFLATEIAYVLKSYLENSGALLKASIRENIDTLDDFILRLFVTANPFALAKYKFHVGLLKPHTLQKLFRHIMFRLWLPKAYYNVLRSEKTILSHILTPNLVDIYADIKSLALPVVTDIVDELYTESYNLKIPNLVNQLKDLFPDMYQELMSKTVTFLIDAFTSDYFNWFSETRQLTALGWRSIKDIYEGITKDNKSKVQLDLFYAHKKKGLPGLIYLLEKYRIIEVREVPSAGRKGKAKRVRINPRFPVIENILKMKNVDL